VGPALKYFSHLLVNSPNRWRPLLAVYYLTYACPFRCPYCSDGNGKPYHELASEILPGEQALKLLKAVRRHCEYLVLTGGEPLAHPDVNQVLDGLSSLAFRKTIFTTNAYGLGPALPAISRSISELVVSLDTLDQAKADEWFGMGAGTLQRILDNIEEAKKRLGRSTKIVVSAVATPGNLDDLFELCDYAWSRGFRLAVCPQLVGVKAHPDLAGDQRYRRLFDHLIKNKRAGRPVEGTIRYLEQMRDLGNFDCRPFTMLTVSPTGDVFYPCLELGNIAGNLLKDNPKGDSKNSDLHTMRKEGLRKFGPQPQCGVQCHSACALGFATILNEPLALASELALMGKNGLRNIMRFSA